MKTIISEVKAVHFAIDHKHGEFICFRVQDEETKKWYVVNPMDEEKIREQRYQYEGIKVAFELSKTQRIAYLIPTEE